MATVAVVVGGSIGGLLAGLVLAEVCDEVVLVERGELSDTPAPRAGVPQRMHAHGLLAGGLAALEQLSPGLCRELEQRGCPTGDNLRDAAWVLSGRRLALGSSGVHGMTLARPVLEHAIRRRVAALPNLSIRTGARVKGLLYDAGCVTGVRVAPAQSGPEEELTADLVVDASGRYSQLPEWLAELGLAPPRIEEVALETHYASRVLVCADALSSFNPTFAQGITVAAKQALLLRDLCTRVPLADLGKVFLSRAAPIVDVAWNTSVGRTFLYPGVVGGPTLKMRIANAYLPRVVARAHEDVEVATALLKVMHFIAPPKSLFAPWMMLRVLARPKPEKRATVPFTEIAEPARPPSRLMSR
jgi:2-polyprenyl-6-methoxyphenol hydroxylase-like FAD-dependent oxidoreductase